MNSTKNNLIPNLHTGKSHIVNVRILDEQWMKQDKPSYFTAQIVGILDLHSSNLLEFAQTYYPLEGLWWEYCTGDKLLPQLVATCDDLNCQLPWYGTNLICT